MTKDAFRGLLVGNDGNGAGASSGALLVIGYGNDLRSDDGAGIRAATLIRAVIPKTRVIATRQLTPDLADDIGLAAQVVFVDAYAASQPGAPLHIERIFAAAAARLPALGHHGEPAILLALTRRLFDRVPDAWVIAIPGFCFDAGEIISAETMRAIVRAAALVAARTFGAE